MYYLEAGYGKHNRLRNAVVLAVALHGALLVGVTFRANEAAYTAPQIDITLTTRPVSTEPEETRFVAQANQQGRDDEPESEPLASLTEYAPPPELAPMESTQEQDALATAAESRTTMVTGQEADPLVGVNPEVDLLSQELASLQAELNEQTRDYANMPRVRRLTSVSARESIDAAYLLNWLRRLEAVGNKYYPEASVRYGIYGSLRLKVVIRYDGSLKDVQVLSSSGYAVLDEAAVKVVRMAAPYAPFPPELRATTDQLEIIRTWHYEEKGLSSR